MQGLRIGPPVEIDRGSKHPRSAILRVQFVLNVCDLTYVGSYVFTGANGDSISGPFTGTLTPTPIPGVFDNDELAFITDGTGRFANATGTFNPGGQIDNNAGTFSLPWQGTISTVGSHRRP
jgi:hypothetical protein